MANANVVDSFSNLCNSYIDLADRFQQLDVEHMTLKSKVIPLLKALKNYQKAISTLQAEKQSLETKLDTSQAELNTSQAEYSLLLDKYESLKALEPLLDENMMALINSAEEQSVLVKETIDEMDVNRDPDLNEEEKSMLELFYADPEAFAATHADQPSIPNTFNPQAFNTSVTPDPALV